MAPVQLSTPPSFPREYRSAFLRGLLCSTMLTRVTGFAAAAGIVAFHPAGVSANPQGGVVSGGSATITQTSPNRIDINQSSQRAIIDWRSFDIGKKEHTNFNQPSKSAVALNRIGDQKASQIQGRLTANGQVFLINPNGIIFGPGSQVDVAGLVATTANIGNADFMAGRYRFDSPSPNRDAMVVNQGDITVRESGLAALVAPGVANSGVISANLGTVELAGATTFTVDLHGDGLMAFEVGGKVAQAPRDERGNPIPALVTNSGTIAASGGTVHLTAAAAAGVVSKSIDMSGVIEARAVRVEGGRIVLSGGDTGRVDVSGTLDASGRATGQRGGSVEVLGDQVALLDRTRIDVSGAKGGGKALVGGAFQGKGPQRNAKRTYIASDVKINADSLTWGNGGQVVVWADQATLFKGNISARGGSQAGDGGLVEVSGKEQLGFYGRADVGAAAGQSGTILLDPQNITIYGNTAPDDLEVAGDGSVFFDDASDTSFTIGASALESLTGNVVLQANRDITVNEDLGFTNQTAGERVAFQAGRNINVNGNPSRTGPGTAIGTNGASIILEADSPHSPIGAADGVGNVTITNASRVASGNGAITMIGARILINTGAVVDAGSGAINLAPARNVPIVIGSVIPDPEADPPTPGDFLSAEAIARLRTTGTITIGSATTAGANGLGADALPLTNAGVTIREGANAGLIILPPDVGGLAIVSSGNVTIPNSGITATGAAITVSAGGSIFGAETTADTTANIVSGGGPISLTAGVDIRQSGSTLTGFDVDSGGGDLTVSTTGPGGLGSAVSYVNPATTTPVALNGSLDGGSLDFDSFAPSEIQVGGIGGLTAPTLSLQTAGPINIVGPVTAATGDVTLNADNAILFASTGSVTAAGNVAAHANFEGGENPSPITMAAGSSITAPAGVISLLATGGVQAANLSGLSATITAEAGPVTTVGAIVTTGNSITIDAFGDTNPVTVSSALSTQQGAVTLRSDGDVQFTASGSITSVGGDVIMTADRNGNGTGAITMADGSGIANGAGDITLQAANAIRAGDITTAGNVAVFAGPEGVTFAGSIDGASSLLVDSAGDVVFGAPVGVNQRLGNVVVGRPDEDFDINDPAIADPETISAAAALVQNRGGDISIAGPFEAAGVIIKTNTATGTITSDEKNGNGIDVSALFVDGRSANLFGSVDGVDGSAAARLARTPSPPSNTMALPGDFLLNGCVIGVGCPQSSVSVPPVDPATAVLGPEKQAVILIMLPPADRGSEILNFNQSFAGPSTARQDEDSLDLLSSSGNEELW